MKIAMIDRVILTRTGLKEIINRQFKIDRFDCIESADESVDWQDYDLAIVNMCMNPDIPIMALINAYEVSIISNLKKLRVDGIVEICSDETVFVNAVKALMNGKGYHLKVKGPRVQLTRRELEILSLVADGMTNNDIASHLYISEKTVKNHLSSIFKKIDVKNRSQVVRYAYDHGIRAL
jgi:DNA-binding NarL/FixJ family response regulator